MTTNGKTTTTSPTIAATIAIGHDDNAHIEKKCENPDCSAPTLISLVRQKQATPLFIHDPTVVPEPILVNGYTTVFEVGGILASVDEFSTVRGTDGKVRYKSEKPIYRIDSGAHAHIVNYIVIDAEGDTLRKIKQNDPATIDKLLESQKNSAEQLLKKLIGIAVAGQVVGPVLPPSKSNTNTNSNISSPAMVPPSQPPLRKALTSSLKTKSNFNSKIIAMTPVISSVSSGVNHFTVSTNASTPTLSTPTVASGSHPISTAMTLQKMQSELKELRETVKLLTENKRQSSGGGASDESDQKKRKTS